MYGRLRGVTTPLNPEFGFGYILCTVDFYFPDPRYYDETATTVTGTAPTLSNTGWATSSPVITIASPSASGSITDGTTTMSFANINTAATLTIDLLQRVIYSGGVATRNVMTGSSNGWLYLAPNTSSVTWTSTVGSMSIPYRNAYI
jgi:phage-related protein